eukprot:gnl/MRDRNA2_/MRDRNA2_59875_c0_seq1.p1 gnl/MRDRNA2_/MRDRNA2_59875_c0~~gnl/MRDRNA2_/MRDRNA2_59875_c0_seq1.p1  ORF type:complete len:274 (+),score=40.44 gnl/MRDRNA2_/MRDRNA2_59875_c0_seq1:71-892(+)
MLGMQTIRMQTIGKDGALPTLLGNSRQRQFLHDVEFNAFGMPKGLTCAEMKASKWAAQEQPKAKHQPSAAEQATPASSPKMQITNEIPLGPAFKALEQKVQTFSHIRRDDKTKFPTGGHARRSSSKPQLSASKAERELMAAVARDDVKKAEALFSEFGSSLMSSFGSLAILQYARNNMSSSGSQSNKMCELLLAQGEVPLMKQGLVKHAENKEHQQFCFDRDVHTKENQAARRSASVPHIWADISYPLSVPKRSDSNTRARRKPVYYKPSKGE